MATLDDCGEDSSTTVFRDVIFLALAGFIAVVMMLLPHLNPPTKAEQDIASPGNVVVEVVWPAETNADLDLWVEAPGDVPVGYSNKGGRIFNLLRDDLGFFQDVSNINYEVSYSRGRPAGEYTVNLHLYKAPPGALPLEVTVMVSLKGDPQAQALRVLSKTFEIGRVGDETTCFRFQLDDDGQFLSASVHDLPRSLRSARK
jgi:hypothetical protein